MKRFLLIQTAFIGDVILATALIEKLKSQVPDIELDFLLRKGNESLLTLHPLINKVLIWDKKKDKYAGLFKLLTKLRATKYDSVINLQRFGSTGFLTAFSGAKQTIGFDKNPFSVLFSKSIKHQIGTGLHEVQRNTKLIEWFTDETVFRPKLYPNVDLSQYKTSKPFVTIAPTSVWFTKQFPESQWVSLINLLLKKYNVYLLGAPDDRTFCDKIIAQVIKNTEFDIQNLAGKLSLLASAALMKEAQMNYVNDSAPMHLCSAVDAPVTAVFCSTIPDFGFGPLSTKSIIVQTQQQLTCRPCGLHGKAACPEGHFKCGFEIDINQFELG